MTRNILPKIIVLSVLVLIGIFYIRNTSESPLITANTPVNKVDPAVKEFPKNKYPLTEANSLWVIASKSRQLNPKDYSPVNLRAPAVPLRGDAESESMMLLNEPATELEKMFASAEKDEVFLKVASAYRSFNTQTVVYYNEVQQYGQETADSQSARAGHSEHQTGLAVDIQDLSGQCVIADCFGELVEGKWLVSNSWRYGFILRYPKDKKDITGYRYEPWHFRYVGAELSRELNRTNTSTLEEFFEVVEKQSY
jgi:D-alanyl-D-alanine carboxypeptidase